MSKDEIISSTGVEVGSGGLGAGTSLGSAESDIKQLEWALKEPGVTGLDISQAESEEAFMAR